MVRWWEYEGATIKAITYCCICAAKAMRQQLTTNQVYMQATIKKTATHYYVLTMGEREMGGTNKQALVNYARKLGFVVLDLDKEQ